MAMLVKSIPIRDLTKQITCHVEITGIKIFGMKIKIAKILIRLAVWIVGMKPKIEET